MNARGVTPAERLARALLPSIALALCVAAVIGAVLLIGDGLGRPNAPAVVEAARSPAADDPRTAMARTVDGLGFPDWRRYSWTPVGGRRDVLADDREAATVLYRNGARTVTYTIIGGTGNVDDEAVMQTRQVFAGGQKIALAQGATAGVLTLKRKRQGRTIVMTAKPNDQSLMRPNDAGGLARTMRRLAVRGIG